MTILQSTYPVENQLECLDITEAILHVRPVDPERSTAESERTTKAGHRSPVFIRSTTVSPPNRLMLYEGRCSVTVILCTVYSLILT